MESFPIKHGNKWWREKGAKCPDCKADSFGIMEQDYKVIIRNCAVHHAHDVEYTATLECRGGQGHGCGCVWKTSVLVYDVLPKTHKYLRG